MPLLFRLFLYTVNIVFICLYFYWEQININIIRNDSFGIISVYVFFKKKLYVIPYSSYSLITMIKILRDNYSIPFSDQLPVFAQAGFLQSKSNDYGWIVDNDFILSFIIDHRLIFKRLIFTSDIIVINSKSNSNNETKQAFIEAACSLVEKELKPDFIASPLGSVKFSTYPEKSIATSYWTYIVNLEEDEQDILKSFNSTTRTEIRKAIRNDFSFSTLDDQSILFYLLRKTFQRSGEELLTPSQDYIETLINNLKGNVATYQVSVNNEIQGVALVTYNQGRAYYYYGASIDRPVVGSLPFLHWSMMMEMKRKGVRSYDLMGVILNAPKGSKDYGIASFKRRFGGVVEEGYIFKIIYSPVKHKLFNLIVALMYRLKGGRYYGDVIDRCLQQQELKPS